MLLSLEHGLWAPNLHFHNPNPKIPALQDGRLQVVDRPLPVLGGIVGINSFGFGGSNVHVILQPNSQPPPPPGPHAALPRLLLASGRTLEGVQGLLELGLQHSQNLAFVSMLNDIAAPSPAAMPFHGYAVLGSQEGSQEVQQVPTSKRPLWFICSGEPRPHPTSPHPRSSPRAARAGTAQRCPDISLRDRYGHTVARDGAEPHASEQLP